MRAASDYALTMQGKTTKDIIVRPFVDGQDEAGWIEIINRLNADLPDTTPVTREDYDIDRNAPDFSAEGRFVAEKDGRVVGRIDAWVDPLDPEHKAFLGPPRVLPEYQRLGIGTLLLERGLDSYRARAVHRVRTFAREENQALQAFLGKHGFTPCRVISCMRRSLAELPSGVGENRQVEICEPGTSNDDLRLACSLINDAMSEHYNFTPSTLEQSRYWNDAMARRGVARFRHLARVNQEPAGILISSIDPKEIEASQKKRGCLDILAVRKQFRHQGIGKALMLSGMRKLKERGMEEAELYVDDMNPVKALRIYQQLGFAVARKISHFELTL